MMNGYRPLMLVTLVSFAGALITILLLFKLLHRQNDLINRMA
jgi:hypothetical protein